MLGAQLLPDSPDQLGRGVRFELSAPAVASVPAARLVVVETCVAGTAHGLKSGRVAFATRLAKSIDTSRLLTEHPHARALCRPEGHLGKFWSPLAVRAVAIQAAGAGGPSWPHHRLSSVADVAAQKTEKRTCQCSSAFMPIPHARTYARSSLPFLPSACLPLPVTQHERKESNGHGSIGELCLEVVIVTLE
eukprot:357392-Chlamydomonas_euryale.AAC.15